MSNLQYTLTFAETVMSMSTHSHPVSGGGGV